MNRDFLVKGWINNGSHWAENHCCTINVSKSLKCVLPLATPRSLMLKGGFSSMSRKKVKYTVWCRWFGCGQMCNIFKNVKTETKAATVFLPSVLKGWLTVWHLKPHRIIISWRPVSPFYFPISNFTTWTFSSVCFAETPRRTFKFSEMFKPKDMFFLAAPFYRLNYSRCLMDDFYRHFPGIWFDTSGIYETIEISARL